MIESGKCLFVYMCRLNVELKHEEQDIMHRVMYFWMSNTMRHAFDKLK